LTVDTGLVEQIVAQHLMPEEDVHVAFDGHRRSAEEA
jgi:hypothetical protein